jgi:hypothetical protein
MSKTPTNRWPHAKPQAGSISCVLRFVFAAFVLVSITALAQDGNPKTLAFLEQYCLKCHDKEAAKGDVVLESFHKKRGIRCSLGSIPITRSISFQPCNTVLF